MADRNLIRLYPIALPPGTGRLGNPSYESWTPWKPYDDTNQLTDAVYAEGLDDDEEYDYDANGNRDTGYTTGRDRCNQRILCRMVS